MERPNLFKYNKGNNSNSNTSNSYGYGNNTHNINNHHNNHHHNNNNYHNNPHNNNMNQGYGFHHTSPYGPNHQHHGGHQHPSHYNGPRHVGGYQQYSGHRRMHSTDQYQNPNYHSGFHHRNNNNNTQRGESGAGDNAGLKQLCKFGISCAKQRDFHHKELFLHICKFGWKCKKQNDLVHLSRFVHGDLCKYGTTCRKMREEDHLQHFLHFCKFNYQCTKQADHSHISRFIHLPRLCNERYECVRAIKRDATHISQFQHYCRFGLECVCLKDFKENADHIRNFVHTKLKLICPQSHLCKNKEQEHIHAHRHFCRDGIYCPLLNDFQHSKNYLHWEGLQKLQTQNQDWKYTPFAPVTVNKDKEGRLVGWQSNPSTGNLEKAIVLVGKQIQLISENEIVPIVKNETTDDNELNNNDEKNSNNANNNADNNNADNNNNNAKINVTAPPKYCWSGKALTVRLLPLTKALEEALGKTVPGLQVTYKEIITEISEKGVAVVVAGATVGKAFRGQPIDTIKLLWGASNQVISQILSNSKWGSTQAVDNTHLRLGSHGSILQGRPFRAPACVEKSNCFALSLRYEVYRGSFSHKAIFYDVTNQVVVDPSGRAIHDLANNGLSIPTKPARFEQWLKEKPKKIASYWAARLTCTPSPEVNKFIKENALSYMTTNAREITAKLASMGLSAHAEKLTALVTEDIGQDLWETYFLDFF